MSVKTIGIVRKVDDLGRIVLPVELRRTLGISERDSLEIFVEGDSIILKKYEPDPLGEDGEKLLICDICKKEMDKNGAVVRG